VSGWGGCVGEGRGCGSWVSERIISEIYINTTDALRGPLLLALFVFTRSNPPFALIHTFSPHSKITNSPLSLNSFHKSSKPSPHPLFSFIRFTVDAGGRRPEENFCSKWESMVVEKGGFGRKYLRPPKLQSFPP